MAKIDYHNRTDVMADLLNRIAQVLESNNRLHMTVDMKDRHIDSLNRALAASAEQLSAVRMRTDVLQRELNQLNEYAFGYNKE